MLHRYFTVLVDQVLTTGLYEGKKADIWSCGVMLYVLLEGSFPFVRNGDEAATGARALQARTLLESQSNLSACFVRSISSQSTKAFILLPRRLCLGASCRQTISCLLRCDSMMHAFHIGSST